MKNTTRILYAAIAVLLLATAFILGTLTGPKSALTGGYDEGYRAGWDAAKQKVAASGLIPGGTEMPMYSISGTIKEISADRLVLETTAASSDPLADPLPSIRTVVISSSTLIQINKEKTAEEYAKDEQEYNKQMAALAAGAVPPMPPSMTSFITGKSSDLAVGDSVTIQGKTGEDLAWLETINEPLSVSKYVKVEGSAAAAMAPSVPEAPPEIAPPPAPPPPAPPAIAPPPTPTE